MTGVGFVAMRLTEVGFVAVGLTGGGIEMVVFGVVLAVKLVTVPNQARPGPERRT